MIDEIDREILRKLQRDGRLTHRQLGAAVGLSPNAAGARVQRLVERGVITGFTVVVNHEQLGRPMETTVDLWLEDRSDNAAFLELVKNDDRVVECFYLTGPLDFRIRARVASASDLNDLLNLFRTEGKVRQTDSRLILEQLAVVPDGVDR